MNKLKNWLNNFFVENTTKFCNKIKQPSVKALEVLLYGSISKIIPNRPVIYRQCPVLAYYRYQARQKCRRQLQQCEISLFSTKKFIGVIEIIEFLVLNEMRVLKYSNSSHSQIFSLLVIVNNISTCLLSIKW